MCSLSAALAQSPFGLLLIFRFQLRSNSAGPMPQGKKKSADEIAWATTTSEIIGGEGGLTSWSVASWTIPSNRSWKPKKESGRCVASGRERGVIVTKNEILGCFITTKVMSELSFVDHESSQMMKCREVKMFNWLSCWLQDYNYRHSSQVSQL